MWSYIVTKLTDCHQSGREICAHLLKTAGAGADDQSSCKDKRKKKLMGVASTPSSPPLYVRGLTYLTSGHENSRRLTF